MYDALLHAGTEHPNLLWLGASSLLAFGAGLGLGAYSDRVRNWIRSDRLTTD